MHFKSVVEGNVDREWLSLPQINVMSQNAAGLTKYTTGLFLNDKMTKSSF